MGNGTWRGESYFDNAAHVVPAAAYCEVAATKQRLTRASYTLVVRIVPQIATRIGLTRHQEYKIWGQ